MSDVSFDPDVFLNQQFEDANDTRIIPCPVGEYPAIVDKVDAIAWASRDGSKSGVKARLLWDIQDENVRQLVGRDKVLVPQDIMFDLTEEGALDMGTGKNVRLGRLREATGLNAPGEPFALPMLQGHMAKVNVKHRPGDDPADIFAEVDRVAKLD